LWVVIALISLIFLLLIVLCIPLDILFSLNTGRNQWFKIHLYWFFGLLGIDLRKKTDRPDTKSGEPSEKKKKPDKFDYNTFIRIIRIRNIFPQVYHLIKGLIRSIQIKIFSMSLRIGLEDPVDNGYFFACIAPFQYLLSRDYKDIEIQPVFENELVFDGDMTIRIRAFPILITGNLLGFIFSPPGLKAIGILWNRKWRRKKS
jgi:hypothetical protein